MNGKSNNQCNRYIRNFANGYAEIAHAIPSKTPLISISLYLQVYMNILLLKDMILKVEAILVKKLYWYT